MNTVIALFTINRFRRNGRKTTQLMSCNSQNLRRALVDGKQFSQKIKPIQLYTDCG